MPLLVMPAGVLGIPGQKVFPCWVSPRCARTPRPAPLGLLARCCCCLLVFFAFREPASSSGKGKGRREVTDGVVLVNM